MKKKINRLYYIRIAELFFYPCALIALVMRGVGLIAALGYNTHIAWLYNISIVPTVAAICAFVYWLHQVIKMRKENAADER